MPSRKRPKKRAGPGRATLARYPTNIVRKVGLDKRQVPYVEKLRVLRSVVSGFDAKKLDRLSLSKPRTARTRLEKRKALQKIARTYARLKPFVTRSFKAVRPKNKANLAELKKYVGISNFKNLRAIPVPTSAPGKTKVSFDKKHRVTVRIGRGYTERLYRFPHMPADVDDAVAMLERMLPDMPAGQYVIATRHHFLIPTNAPKELLTEVLQEFWTQYAARSPEFIKLVFGFKWMGRGDISRRRIEEIASERGRAQQARRDARINERLRAVKAMDAYFKGNSAERLLGLPSRAARGLPWNASLSHDEAKKILKKKKPRLSKRARVTGRG